MTFKSLHASCYACLCLCNRIILLIIDWYMHIDSAWTEINWIKSNLLAKMIIQESIPSVISIHNKCHCEYAACSITCASSFNQIFKCNSIELIPLFIVQSLINLSFELRGELNYCINCASVLLLWKQLDMNGGGHNTGTFQINDDNKYKGHIVCGISL